MVAECDDENGGCETGRGRRRRRREGGRNNELRRRRLGSLEREKRWVLTRRGYISELETNNGGFEAAPANFPSYLGKNEEKGTHLP